jgi:FkbM family methyltransferase
VVRHLVLKPSGRVCHLSFREGFEVAYRPETEDWEVVKEVMLYGVYSVCLEHVTRQTDKLPVLDLGANIGLFSLRIAHMRPEVEVHAYEPAPRNLQMISTNLHVNPTLLPRVKVHAEAVGGSTRTASFFYDEKVPQGSSLFTSNSQGNIPVTVRSFAEIVEGLSTPLGLVKMDVEGAEYEILRQTSPKIWEKVRALSIEIHDDPAGKLPKKEMLAQIESLGYTGVKEKAGASSYFFYRGAFAGE